ncbi:Protein kinase-like domain protein [Metarhizium rileyi]|uniref:Protein kinase-like domain protein n=1 Tax=Metarhizium rileyi (strain RCEF 4871) TaxID=1649241 RepID=A0A166WVY3_METRR|nr:Protein kinase-like domain protein [Metarhizium rileyi RCEF 4871]
MPGATKDSEVVLKYVRSLRLPHPDGELLECFIQDSLDPVQAARYMKQRCSLGGKGLDLECFLSDWKQLINTCTSDEGLKPGGWIPTDGLRAVVYKGPTYVLRDKAIVAKVIERDRGRCCITGFGNSFWDPLVVTPILPARKIHVDETLLGLFDAFVGPELRDWVLSDAASSNPYRNHWLVRKSAAAALSEGFYMFNASERSQYHVFQAIIGGPAFPPIIMKTPVCRTDCFITESLSHLDPPDACALQVVSRFAKPIRWTMVSREIKSKRPDRSSRPQPASIWRCIPEWGAEAMIMAWRLLPAPLRTRAYRGLICLGALMYEPSCSFKVRRLPLGMYIKVTKIERHEGLANENAALQLVRRHTDVPVPRVLDLVSDSTSSYLLTTRLSGICLGIGIDTLSDDEAETLVRDLQKCLAELRSIPKLVSPEYVISNARGKACYDYRILAATDRSKGYFFGPFVTEEQFNDGLRVGALPQVSHDSGHQMVFTHGDLNMRNVLMHNGRLSGIVDWENSGWYPTYWDYTKAHYITRFNQRWLKMTDRVFERFGDFSAELSTERQLWWYCY